MKKTTKLLSEVRDYVARMMRVPRGHGPSLGETMEPIEPEMGCVTQKRARPVKGPGGDVGTRGAWMGRGRTAPLAQAEANYRSCALPGSFRQRSQRHPTPTR